jgi:hypothetical protein
VISIKLIVSVAFSTPCQLERKADRLDYTTWFMPDVEIVDEKGMNYGVINYGDLLHVDFGVTALGLNTDTQHLGYVLYPGETEKDVPKGLLEGLEKGNRMQDIVVSNMKVGKTGNEILAASLAQMEKEGIKGRIYSHPIGDWGHAAGAVIGECILS